MRFFPRSFVATVDSLNIRERTVFKEIATESIKGLQSVALDEKGVEDLFDPALLSYIRS